MGTTYVTLGWDAQGTPTGDPDSQVGFWMHDWMLELWLRLLALHLCDPSPEDTERTALARVMRAQWLLASKGWFVGCVPHGLDEFAKTDAGLEMIKDASVSLARALDDAPELLSCDVLNLLGMEGRFPQDVETWRLRQVALAFNDLLNGKITSANHDLAFMPGEDAARPAGSGDT